MFSRFFIDRPIFAAVLSIVITLAGGLAVFSLPLAQYPPVTPPTVQVDCNYPGASAQVVAETRGRADRAAGQRRREHALHVVAVHQRRLVQPDGDVQARASNLNMAQVLVQNRVNLAMPMLPRRAASRPA